jgi:type IV pilus assembly protein PilQ
MGKMPSLMKKGLSFVAYLAMAGLTVSGCATISDNPAAREKAKAPVIQTVEVRPSADRVVVEFINSEAAPYTAFKLLDPPRIVLDIRGELADALPRTKEVQEGGITDIRLEQGKTQAISSRAVIGLNRPVDFEVKASDSTITVTITPEKEIPRTSETTQKAAEAGEKKGPVTPSEPRIFFKDHPGNLTQILGLDFTLLDQGKSRLIVTTDKKARYDLNQKGPKSLLLNISKATIPPLIMRHMDSKYFEGVVELVKTSLSSADQGVAIAITLREMVPFHVNQSDTGITIDFGPTTIKPPEKQIVPLHQAKASMVSKTPAPVRTEAAVPQQGAQTQRPMQWQEVPGVIGIEALKTVGPGVKKNYTGTAMTMDFVNADVTNILRLVAEVSNLNIVWGPEVKGSVSMRLKDVPWDQALDLVLDNNNLGMRRQGNVIWVTTKAQMAQIEAEERRKIQEYEARLEAERKKLLQEKEKEKELEPLVTQYIPVDFAKASEILPLLTLSETGKNRGGKLSVDARTNMIIMNDIASNVRSARDTVKIFDTPVKQVMIEARIVDATDDFRRDLGVRWDNVQVQHRTSTGVPFTGFNEAFPVQTAPGDPSGYPAGGGRLASPTFATNSPEAWAPNLGLVFSKLSASQLTATVLDAKLALSEAEGKTKIISAPKVIAMNGQAATISRGDSIIIPATENVASTTLDATLSLEVTPTVSYNNYVSLDVKVTDDNAPTNTRIQKKSINTKLMVKSGDTIVIGGIYSEEESLDEDGIPGLRRIPLLGWLFKAQESKLNKRELLIFLTPSVLPAYTKS